MDHMIRYTMYLGRNITDSAGKHVATIEAEAIDTFLADIVDPLFEAYTVSHVRGVWEGNHEDTVKLEFILPKSALFENLLVIANAYKETFFQDCVLTTMEYVNTMFV